MKIYRTENKDKIKESKNNWRKENKEKIKQFVVVLTDLLSMITTTVFVNG